MSKAYAFVPDGCPREPNGGDHIECDGGYIRLGAGAACLYTGKAVQVYRRIELPEGWTPPEPPRPRLPVLVPTGNQDNVVEVSIENGRDIAFVEGYREVSVEELRAYPQVETQQSGNVVQIYNSFHDGYRACLKKLGIE